MPVTSDQLPFSLLKAADKQPSPNELPFALRQKLGLKLGEVTANALPLALSRNLSDQPHASKLPFKLSQPRGILVGDGYIDHTPIEPPTPPKPQRRMLGLMMSVSTNISDSESVVNAVASISSCQLVARKLDVMRQPTHLVNNEIFFATQNLVNIINTVGVSSAQSQLISHCALVNIDAFVLLASQQSIKTTPVINYATCADVYSAKSVLHRKCVTILQQPVINYSSTVAYQQSSRLISKQQTTRTKRSVPVPCRYYPIPEPPPEKPQFSCKIRPPASQLILSMTRRRGRIASSNLPFNLICWHDQDKQPLVIPNIRTYIMYTTITANIGGINVDPLSFDIKASMDGAYWQGGIDISPEDFAKIKDKVNVLIGDEPMINVTINGHLFSIVAENNSRNRRFINQTYSISGRSITARLGADYAVASDQLFDADSYASQIARQQLQGLPITITDFDVADWLIPADTYSISNKTPIAVIAELADAAGGYVTSHPSEPTLAIKQRWAIPAWEIATANPVVTISSDIIISSTDQTNKNPRFNTVTLVGDKVAHAVYRSRQSRDKEAATLTNALFTSQDVTIPKGTAVLSNSGTHAIYTLKIIWIDEMPLARFGEVWQVNDTAGAWRGVVQDVAISIETNNDASIPYQTITFDRYLDS